MTAIRAALYALLLTLATGCLHFDTLTREMVQEYDLSEGELELIQYYNSSKIVLERLDNTNRQITDGKLESESRVLEVNEVRCLTPGVVEKAEEYKDLDKPGDVGQILWVSFERGTLIPFVGYGRGIYALFAPKGTVKILDKTYVVKNDLVSPGAVGPHLLIEEDGLEAIEVYKKLPGRKLEDEFQASN